MNNCQIRVALRRIATELRNLPRVETIDRGHEVHLKAARVDSFAEQLETAAEHFEPCFRRKSKNADPHRKA